MKFYSTIMKIAGKGDFTLDSRIDKSYIMHMCWKYGWMLIRGRITACGNPCISNRLFRGKRVTILGKKQVSIADHVKLHDGVYIDALSTDGVQLGEGVVLGRNCRIECTGSLSKIGKGVAIGDRSSFGSDCYFGAAGGVIIGSDVMAGQYVRFHSENHNSDNLEIPIREQGVSHKGIVIGNNCWIGAGAVFLDGAELGDGCVVAANAVVTKVFADNSVIGGVPAKVIKRRGEIDE